jgi:nucleoside-diphosphate-sugar epimerase
MDNLKKALVIGSRGFIGQHMVVALLAQDYIVNGIDIVEFHQTGYQYFKISALSPDFRNLLSSNKYDYIINCAGSGNVGYSIEHPLSDYELNTHSVFHILDGIRISQPGCRFIHFSSAAVYGDPIQLPISENSVITPISPYGYHKYHSELICKEFSTLYSIPILVLRPFSVYGPGLRKQLLWDIFQKAHQNQVIELWGSGNESRDFIYVTDMCNIILALLNKNLPLFETLNLATGESVSISSIAQILLNKLNYSNTIEFNEFDKVGNPKYWKADVSRLKHYGSFPKTSLEDGISKTAEWMITNG